MNDAWAARPPLDRDGADRALAHLREERDRISTALLELEGHPGYQLLDGAAVDGETRRVPAKSVSSPAAIRRSVVLPQPDGPINAPKLPASRLSARPRITSTGFPSAERNVLLSIRSSSASAPALGSSFKWLHQKVFNCQHDCDER